MKKYFVLVTLFLSFLVAISAQAGSVDVQASLDLGPQFPSSMYPEYYNKRPANKQVLRNQSQDRSLAAARHGNPESQIAVALEYLTGKSRPQNELRAFKWLQLAEKNGSGEASVYLASMYYYGEGTKQNYEEAFKRFSKAANDGNSLAQFNLHVMYDVGYGTLVDKEKALYWLRRSAESGFTKAQTKLGMLYKTGGLLERNLQKSIEWLHRAANAGDKEGQIQLAKIYAMGIGARQNYLVSYIWFNIAGDKCEPGIERQQCISYTNSIASALSPREREKARKLAIQKRKTMAQNNNIPTIEKVIIQ